MSKFKGKVAIVTGAGSGIGRAVAIQLAKEGALVSVVTRTEQNGLETIKEIEKIGGTALFIRADVRKNDDVETYVKKTIEHFGRIDIFFNNAGVMTDPYPLCEFPEELFDLTMDTNVKGAFLGLQHVIPEMLRNGGGAIVCTSSVVGLKGNPGVAPYSASKHAIIGLAKSAVGDYGSKGIRINVVCPGCVYTPMMARFASKMTPDDPGLTEKMITANIPMGRYSRVDEVSNLVLFLLSEEAKIINGSVYTIDGGQTAV
ncbi:glucose 1-dehydrogenase (plasmid) [Paenibacillus thiaminolyticus]|uniref:SDR family NAD(P)-dependent oxidoreductase n=1 Tax=Paenibacillus thiaminolyticus TaxID=49283 RepID=UPI00232F8C1B|nr:glucose 1-dehydrogenase [Paenibacillus thiaminolyticus]WCF11558.1 glucose 1-dehydrogenase [Paenibacillus thiaminolyticus]